MSSTRARPLLRRRPAILSRRLGDGVLLATVDGDGFDRLTLTGAAAWELLAEPRSCEGLCEALGARFGIAPQEIRGDVELLVRDLTRRGLLEEVGDA